MLFMLWVFVVMIVMQIYDNVTGKGMPARSSPTPIVQGPGTEAARLAELRACVAANPDDLNCTLQLAALQYAARQWEQAQVSYERAVRLDPGNGQTLLKLGGTYIQQLKFEEASATLSQSVALQPESPEAHLLLGLALSRLPAPREADAVVEWRKVIELAPGSTWATQAEGFIAESGR